MSYDLSRLISYKSEVMAHDTVTHKLAKQLTLSFIKTSLDNSWHPEQLSAIPPKLAHCKHILQ